MKPLTIDSLSDLQEDSYFSKRFCLDISSFNILNKNYYQHNVSTLENTVGNSLNYIYNNLFTTLKETDVLQDYYTFVEQGHFYCYLFSNDISRLHMIGLAVKSFHKEIQPFLLDNTESEFYYSKLFDTILLTTKLENKSNIIDNNFIGNDKLNNVTTHSTVNTDIQSQTKKNKI